MASDAEIRFERQSEQSPGMTPGDVIFKLQAQAHGRFRREREGLTARTRAGEERIRHVAGRFFIKRLENVGATGYRRSWSDNILWHHFCHFVDLGLRRRHLV